MKSASYQDTVGNITPGVDIKFEWDKANKNGYNHLYLEIEIENKPSWNQI
jgi:hypothetical protein